MEWFSKCWFSLNVLKLSTQRISYSNYNKFHFNVQDAGMCKYTFGLMVHLQHWSTDQWCLVAVTILTSAGFLSWEQTVAFVYSIASHRRVKWKSYSHKGLIYLESYWWAKIPFYSTIDFLQNALCVCVCVCVLYIYILKNDFKSSIGHFLLLSNFCPTNLFNMKNLPFKWII